MIRVVVVVSLSLTALIPLGVVMALLALVDIPATGYLNITFALFGVLYSLSGFAAYKYLVVESRDGVGVFESLLAFSLTWLLVPFLFSIPLATCLGVPLLDAFFESVSGFTGTGLTVLTHLEALKPSVLVWRAVMQWIGELGIVVFAVVLMPFIWRFSYILYSLERSVRILASLRRTAIRVFQLYVVLTLTGIIACLATGMNLLDAVVHTMTAIATGGMSNYDVNYQRVYEYAPLSVYPITALMFLGGVNFTVLNLLLVARDYRRAWLNEEFKAYIYLSLIAVIASSILLLPRVELSIVDALLYGSFNSLSGFTTTGFSIGSIESLPVDVKALITVFMFIGSMSFSTVGGIKVIRVVVLLKTLKSYVINIISGGAVQPAVKLSSAVLEEREVFNNLLIVVLHFTLVSVGSLLIKSLVPSRDFSDALFEATSAASAVGLSTGITGPHAPLGVKLVLIVLMYLGKLEYIPLLALIGLLVYKKYSVIAK
ncbi:MAG: TrkH family potassium uptake protein [Desulfurococcaceae archaeon]